MAEDGILNTSNAGCLKLLIDKGIISMVDGKNAIVQSGAFVTFAYCNYDGG